MFAVPTQLGGHIEGFSVSKKKFVMTQENVPRHTEKQYLANKLVFSTIRAQEITLFNWKKHGIVQLDRNMIGVDPRYHTNQCCIGFSF